MSPMSRNVTAWESTVTKTGFRCTEMAGCAKQEPEKQVPFVTKRDEIDIFPTQAADKVPAMKTKSMYLTGTSILALLLASPLTADETNMRYSKLAGSYQLEVEHMIQAGEDYSHPAERTFSMSLDMQDSEQAVTATLVEVSGTYTAHEMTQRLPTRHLKGKSLQLVSAHDGRALAQSERDDEPRIGLGAITPEGYPLSMALSDMLPVLPSIAVETGSSWTTESALNSLVGWGWISGKLDSRHTVTGTTVENGKTLVSVESTAQATINNPIDGGKYSLTRTTHWQFNATDGRLVSLSMNEDAYAVSKLPQGNVPVHQVTKASLKL